MTGEGRDRFRECDRIEDGFCGTKLADCCRGIFLRTCSSFLMASDNNAPAENIRGGMLIFARALFLPAIGAVMTVAMVVVPWMTRTDSYYDLRIGWGAHRTQGKQHTQSKDPTSEADFHGTSLTCTYKTIYRQ